MMREKSVLFQFLEWLDDKEYLCSTVYFAPDLDDDTSECLPQIGREHYNDIISDFMKDHKKSEEYLKEAFEQDAKDGKIYMIIEEACHDRLNRKEIVYLETILDNFIKSQLDEEDRIFTRTYQFLYNAYGCQLQLDIEGSVIDDYPELVQKFSHFTLSHLVKKQTIIINDYRTGDCEIGYILLFDVGA